MQMMKKTDDDWVARILEIRIRDEHHVYARVYWTHWPDELPQGTYDGKKMVHGRQPYHGMNELVASHYSKRSRGCGAASARPNTDIGEVDIIDVLGVASRVQVKQWYEENDEDIQHGLFRR